MRQFFLALIFTFCFITCPFTQVVIPHISGQIAIDTKNGKMECTLDLSNLPTDQNYKIGLNKFMHGLTVSDPSSGLIYEATRDSNKNISNEAYIFDLNNTKSESLPSRLKFHYIGNFNVADNIVEASQTGDRMENIAFNGKTIRASEQSAWYPIIYDVDNAIMLDKVTYDLSIHCNGCKSIYINGSEPFKGSHNNFKSIDAFALVLFAGEVDFIQKDKTNFMNSGLNKVQENAIDVWTKNIMDYYEAKLGKPYGNNITYIYSPTVSKENARVSFTYPAMTITGHEKYSFKNYFRNDNRLRDSSLVQFLSHEMGHYYIGNVLVPNGTLRWAFLEGITEYMSLLATRDLIGEKTYRSKLIDYLSEINGYEPKSLSTINNGEIDEIYRYAYMPLLLSALEKKVGKEAMWRWLSTLINTDRNIATDFTFFKSSLLKSGIPEADYKVFEFICINANNAKENVVKIINKGL